MFSWVHFSDDGDLCGTALLTAAHTTYQMFLSVNQLFLITCPTDLESFPVPTRSAESSL